MLRLCAFVFGIGLGGDYMLIPVMAPSVGLRVMGRLLGLLITADGLAEAVVPMMLPRCAIAPAAIHSGSPC
jgi:hypothetical protein